MVSFSNEQRYITLTGESYNDTQSTGISQSLRSDDIPLSLISTLIATAVTDNIEFAPFIFSINIGLFAISRFYSEKLFLRNFARNDRLISEETIKQLIIDKEPEASEAANSVHKYHLTSVKTKKSYAIASAFLCAVPLLFTLHTPDKALIGLAVLAPLIMRSLRGATRMKRLQTGEWAIISPPTITEQKKVDHLAANVSLAPA